MLRASCWLWLISLLIAPRGAAGASGLQPTSVPLGTVATGTTIEASFLVFGNSATTAGLKVDVQPPEFVRIERVRLITRGEPKKKLAAKCSFRSTRPASANSRAMFVLDSARLRERSLLP